MGALAACAFCRALMPPDFQPRMPHCGRGIGEDGMKRPSLLAEDRWRDRPWPKDPSSLRQNPGRSAVVDIRIWLLALPLTLIWATWDLVSRHFWSAVLPSLIVIEAAIFVWLGRSQIVALWRRLR